MLFRSHQSTRILALTLLSVVFVWQFGVVTHMHGAAHAFHAGHVVGEDANQGNQPTDTPSHRDHCPYLDSITTPNATSSPTITGFFAILEVAPAPILFPTSDEPLCALDILTRAPSLPPPSHPAIS